MLEMYIGWSIFPSPGCARMAPREMPDASTCTWNLVSQLVNIKIGVVLHFSLRMLNALSHSGLHRNSYEFFNNFSRGVMIVEYLLMNLW